MPRPSAFPWIVSVVGLLLCGRAQAGGDDSEVAFLKTSPVEVRDDALSVARACDEGAAAQCYQLGNLYEEGLGLPSAPERSRRLYARACEAGRGEACRALGWLELVGLGRKTLSEAGAKAFGDGCALGFLDNCVTLGEALVEGKLLTADRARGGALLGKACAGGYVEGCFALRAHAEALEQAGVDTEVSVAPSGEVEPPQAAVCPALYYITTNNSGGPVLNRRLAPILGEELAGGLPKAVEGWELSNRYAFDAGTASMRASSASLTLSRAGESASIWIADHASNCTLQRGTGRAMVGDPATAPKGVSIGAIGEHPSWMNEHDGTSEMTLWVADRCVVHVSAVNVDAKGLQRLVGALDLSALSEVCRRRDAGLLLP